MTWEVGDRVRTHPTNSHIKAGTIAEGVMGTVTLVTGSYLYPIRVKWDELLPCRDPSVEDPEMHEWLHKTFNERGWLQSASEVELL